MGGFKLVTLFGIPIRVTFSFLLLLGFALLAWGGLQGVVAIIAMFTMVLAHELGHALVARKLSVPILGIDLHFFGGAAKLAHLPQRPRDEILIAAAGPAVSFALSAIAFALHGVTEIWVLRWVGYINLMLGGFNLLPALPMDGGRIFRAALSSRLGRLRATTIAVHVARGVAVLMGLWGVLGLWPLANTSFFMVGLAVMLWWMAGSELRAMRYWETMQQPGMGGYPGAGAHGAPGVHGNQAAYPQGGPGNQQAYSQAGPWSPQPQTDPAVEVLDQYGRPIAGQPWGQVTVEQQQGPGPHYWIIRDASGRIIFRTNQPRSW